MAPNSFESFGAFILFYKYLKIKYKLLVNATIAGLTSRMYYSYIFSLVIRLLNEIIGLC